MVCPSPSGFENLPFVRQNRRKLRSDFSEPQRSGALRSRNRCRIRRAAGNGPRPVDGPTRNDEVRPASRDTTLLHASTHPILAEGASRAQTRSSSTRAAPRTSRLRRSTRYPESVSQSSSASPLAALSPSRIVAHHSTAARLPPPRASAPQSAARGPPGLRSTTSSRPGSPRGRGTTVPVDARRRSLPRQTKSPRLRCPLPAAPHFPGRVDSRADRLLAPGAGCGASWARSRNPASYETERGKRARRMSRASVGGNAQGVSRREPST